MMKNHDMKGTVMTYHDVEYQDRDLDVRRTMNDHDVEEP
jgi:hypothetical protein